MDHVKWMDGYWILGYVGVRRHPFGCVRQHRSGETKHAHDGRLRWNEIKSNRKNLRGCRRRIYRTTQYDVINIYSILKLIYIRFVREKYPLKHPHIVPALVVTILFTMLFRHVRRFGGCERRRGQHRRCVMCDLGCRFFRFAQGEKEVNHFSTITTSIMAYTYEWFKCHDFYGRCFPSRSLSFLFFLHILRVDIIYK